MKYALNYLLGYITGLENSKEIKNAQTVRETVEAILQADALRAARERDARANEAAPANETPARTRRLEDLLADTMPEDHKRVEALGDEARAIFYHRLELNLRSAVARGLTYAEGANE